MIAVLQWILGAVALAACILMGSIAPISFWERLIDRLMVRLEESANRFRRLRLLEKHHRQLLANGRRVFVRSLAAESFHAKYKRDPYDSRGMLLLKDDAVMYWDLGQSTRIEPYVYKPGEAGVMLHAAEPHREGEHVWLELEHDGVSRFLQTDTACGVNEKTRTLFADVERGLHGGARSA